MNRVAPPAIAASTRLAEATRRMRSFSAHAPGRNIRKPDGRWVARLITASCPATAPRTASGANRSTSTAAAPARSISARDCARCATAVTRWPATDSNGSTRRPITPVGPVRKIRMPAFQSTGHSTHTTGRWFRRGSLVLARRYSEGVVRGCVRRENVVHGNGIERHRQDIARRDANRRRGGQACLFQPAAHHHVAEAVATRPRKRCVCLAAEEPFGMVIILGPELVLRQLRELRQSRSANGDLVIGRGATDLLLVALRQPFRDQGLPERRSIARAA